MPFVSTRPWLVPLLISFALLALLLGAIPYAATYGTAAHLPLGGVVWQYWNTSADWEHCMLVPLIIGGLIWWRRNALASLPLAGHNAGLIALTAGLFFFWFGFRAETPPAGYIGIQLLLAGLILWFGGWPWMRALFFPWVFLTFAWPMPFLDSIIAFPLRILMSKVTYLFLNLIGIDCILNGTAVVSSPNFALGIPQGQKFAVDIADPCSGIRSLFALMMLTALYGYLTLRQAWKQWVLFFCAAPLAILGNFIRMLMLTFGTILFGSEFAIGKGLEHPSTYHLAAGFAVFIAAIGGMIGIHWLLERDWNQVWTKLKSIKNQTPKTPPARHLTTTGDSY
jgi:exosortase